MYQLIAPGWLDVLHIASPFYNLRPKNTCIDTLIIHNISLPPSDFGSNAQFIHELFKGELPLKNHSHPYLQMIKNFEVSSHFLISRQAEVFQYVSTDLRAWHAGQSNLFERTNCNDFSIGIELEGDDFSEFEPQQYICLMQLIESLAKFYPIKYIASHAFIAPDRKTDPGPFFNWAILEDKYSRPINNNINNNINNINSGNPTFIFHK